MEFRILGPIEVWDGGRSLPLGGPKQRALLAILLIQVNRVVATDRLIDLIWPAEAPDTAGHSLQVYVSELRKVLEPKRKTGTAHSVLISRPPGYLISVEGEELDLTRFQRLVDEGRKSMSQGAPEAASTKFREALGLWRGAPLADFAMQPFAVSEIARLTELRLRALEARIEADLAFGRHGDLVGELEALVAQHPLREAFSRHLMLALYRSARQAEASDVYQRARVTLADELGMEPGAELQKMLKAILNQDAALDLEPKTSPTPKRRHNLPRQLTTFIGRTREVSEVKRLLSQAGLVTLTGTGGVGKTRLAIEVAGQLADSYRDGVWLVELASVQDPEVVPQSVASTLGVREEADRALSDSLADYLHTRHQLLVIDNCEHLIEGTAQLVAQLLQNCPDLQVLATSREALSIGGEVAWRVPSLSLPNVERRPVGGGWADNDSMALFVDRAAAALGSFQLDAKNGPVVLQVCERLDGIPLAIELAVGKLKVLSLEQIAGRLNDRFHLLTGGSRTALPRQQTLAAAIDWSFDLLPAPQQAVLRRLSVFAGGFDLEAAESVCPGGPVEGAQVLDVLARLIDKSLLQTVTVSRDVRYQLLETIRQYADVKLHESGEADLVRDRHRDWFLALAESVEPEQAGSEKVDADLDNIRVALGWAKEARPDLGLRLAVALIRFWAGRGYYAEGIDWLRLFAGVPEAPSATRIKALNGIGRLAQEVGDNASASEALTEALRLARASGDALSAAFAMNNLGTLAEHQGDYEASGRYLQESLDVLRKVGKVEQVTTVLTNLSQVYFANEDFERARATQQESLALQREDGDLLGVAISVGNLAQIALMSDGDLDEAARLAVESLNTSRELGDQLGVALSLQTLGDVARRRGAFDEAAERLGKSLEILRDQGLKPRIAGVLESFAVLAAVRGEGRLALRLAGAAATVRDAIQMPSAPVYKREVEATMETARTTLTAAAADQAWREGRQLSVDSAIATALATFGRTE